ncbi:MAG: molecular chaperone HtpG [Chitinophagales bacterium]|nr:molecular chaperone HtpG [Chitinophagales bacterium]
MQTGTISVQTENIFPIIKKFLYSDHEIFLRELVSNAVDATTKLQVLAQRGEVKHEIGDTTIEIIQEADQKRLIIRDRGIGMTEEEVLKYLNQIAFSSATEFLEKYKDSGIIGHFGLGFYSAFMVADKVEVVTKSWQEGAAAVRWTCAGDPSYTIEPAPEKADRGTDIILYINEENKDFLEKFKLEGLLDKYCRFLPIPIQFGTRTEYVETGEGEDKQEESVEVPNIINETRPIWKKQPSELNDADYKAFYRQLFPMAGEPMFWIHLNIDFPFNLTGVLYFPKLGGSAMELQRNKIHLYSNQVFVTDDVRDIVPEWLQLLHGVIDSPDIPLNVSRSYLQADGNVKKISEHITKKVADKLHELFKNDRGAFEQKWRDLGVFVKYGIISDTKFEDRAKNFVLVENTKAEFFLLSDYKDKIKENQTDKHSKTVVIYTNDSEGQHAQIAAAEARGYDVLKLDTVLDNHWMQHVEYRSELGLTFVRVDSATTDQLVQKDDARESVLSETEQNDLKGVFETAINGQPGASVQLSALSPDEQPVQIVKPEFMRRMKEMQALHGMGLGDMPDSYQVVINSNHPLLVNKLLKSSNDTEKQGMAKYLFNLALLQQGMLRGEALTGFVKETLAKV